MTIKRHLLLSLLRWINNQPLKGVNSRKRTNFINNFREQILNTESYRTRLVSEVVKKDDKGNPIVLTDELGRKSYDISEEDQRNVASKLEVYLNEEVEIKTTGKENKVLAEFMANLLEETTYEFKGKEADDYDEWYKAFEEVAK